MTHLTISLAMQRFEYGDLSPRHQVLAVPFYALANIINKELVASPEKSITLRKLADAKDQVLKAVSLQLKEIGE